MGLYLSRILSNSDPQIKEHQEFENEINADSLSKYVGEIDRHGIPKNAIVIITVHGQIHHNYEDVSKKKIKGVKSIYKFNAGTPGICSYIGADDLENYIKKIKNYYRDEIDNTDEEIILQNYMDNVKDDIKPEYIQYIEKEYKNYKQKLREKKVEDKETTEYIENALEHRNESCNIYKFDRGSDIVNKMYNFNRSDGDISRGIDWNITLLNSDPPNFDLGKSIVLNKGRSWSRYNNIIMSTETIINYLSNLGVERILFFDFSCVSINNIEDRRVLNYMKRDALDTGYGGNKYSKKNTIKKMATKKKKNKIRKSYNNYKVK